MQKIPAHATTRVAQAVSALGRANSRALPVERLDAYLPRALRAQGRHDSQQLEAPATAKSCGVRDGKASIVDGPFAETKEILGGFNLIEADDMDDALRIAAEFPWAKFGCIEVRPVRDFDGVRRRVGV